MGGDHSASATGYPDDDPAGRALLILSHAALLPSIWLAWRGRNEGAWLLFALLTCFTASSTYHACYSYSACYFTDPRVHRQLDHYFSGMLLPVTATAFLWHRRPRARVGRGVVRLEYYRPLLLDPFVLCLYLGNLYLHVAGGMDHFGSKKTLAVGTLLVAGAHVSEAVATGLRVRVRLFVVVAGLLTLGFGVFQLDDELGAWGHDAWHLLSFAAIYIYLRLGPVFTAADGTCVRAA